MKIIYTFFIVTFCMLCSAHGIMAKTQADTITSLLISGINERSGDLDMSNVHLTITDSYFNCSSEKLSGDVDLALQSLDAGNQEMIFPIKITSLTFGNYKITQPKKMNVDGNVCIFLEDRLLGNIMDLKTFRFYSFYLNDSSDHNRFFIHLRKPLLTMSIDPDCSYKTNGKAIVSAKGMGACIFEWRDILGNTLTRHDKSSDTDTLKNLAPGIYYVTVKGKNKMCSSVTETIQVSSASQINVHSFIQHNEAPSERNGIVSAGHVTGGTAPYYYEWSNNTCKEDIRDVSSGLYTLILTDSKGCSDTSYHVIKTKNVSEIKSKLNLMKKKDSGKHTDNVYVFPQVSSKEDSELFSVKNVLNSKTKFIKDEEVIISHIGEKALVKFNLIKPSQTEVSVCTSEGKVLKKFYCSAYKNVHTIDLGDKPGVYIVSVLSNGNRFQNKIIK